MTTDRQKIERNIETTRRRIKLLELLESTGYTPATKALALERRKANLLQSLHDTSIERTEKSKPYQPAFALELEDEEHCRYCEIRRLREMFDSTGSFSVAWDKQGVPHKGWWDPQPADDREFNEPVYSSKRRTRSTEDDDLPKQ